MGATRRICDTFGDYSGQLMSGSSFIFDFIGHPEYRTRPKIISDNTVLKILRTSVRPSTPRGGLGKTRV